MKLSAPVYRLKRKAKLLARKENVPLHKALDQVAFEEGYGGWSLLAAKQPMSTPARRLFAQLAPGDIVLIGARPGQGKTLMSLELAVEAMRAGRRSAFFTLEYTQRDILNRFRAIGVEPAQFGSLFAFDCSNAIDAAYIIEAMAAVPHGTLIVVDYLQLLDQKRESSPLAAQVAALRSFAQAHGAIIVFISQIDRAYDPSKKPFPDLRDIRLPNPLDLKLFDKMCFLNGGKVQFHAAV